MSDKLDKKTLNKIIQEKEKRKKLTQYENDFACFAEEQIKIVTKDASKGFVPFTLNTAQKIITEKLSAQLKKTGKVRAIILKARQQGISTYCVGRVYWKSYFMPHSKSVVMAHDSATSDSLFGMSKSVIQYMPKEFRPQEIKSNAKEIVISSPAMRKDADGEKPKASYRLYTAGSPEAGRGTTPTVAHLSEVAFWQQDDKILAGLFQGISGAPGTEVILESTANGIGGEFHRLWQNAVAGISEYIPIFLPWYITPEYITPPLDGFERTIEEDEYVEVVKKKSIILNLSEDGVELNDQQLQWRRFKIAEGGELKFKQEYPTYPEEAFIATGDNVFDIDKLNVIPTATPKQQLYFQGVEFGGGFEKGKGGHLSVWEFPKVGRKYIIAADVSLGIGKDYQCSVVMDEDRKIVALFRDNEMDTRTYAETLFYLGRFYNNGLMIVESNSMGVAVIQKLEDLNYINLYRQTGIAQINKEEGLRLGFRTTGTTKGPIIANLRSAIMNDEITIYSSVIIQEMRDYIHVGNNKTEAGPGAYDDTVMATAFALEAYRTHGHKLTRNNLNWADRVDNFDPPEDNWI